jgi:hypothetical protein
LLVLAVSVSVAQCGIGDLVSPGEGDRVALSAGTVAMSAAVGSRALMTQTVQVVSESGRTVTWTAQASRGSRWLSLNPADGTVPSTITVRFDPTDLSVGVFHDTLLFATGGNDGAPTPLPVEFTITDCELREFTPGEEMAESLSDADCESPNRPGHFAQVYRFEGLAGDSVTVVMRSADVDGFVILAAATEVPAPSATAGSLAAPSDVSRDPRLPGGAPSSGTVDLTRPARFRLLDTIAARIQAEPVAEADGCEEEGTDACLINVLLPEDGTYIVEATTATAGETGDYTLEIAGPRDPFDAGLLRQFQTDGVTPVLEGGNVSGTEVLLTALVTDLDEFDSLLVEVEVETVGVAFDDMPTASGSLVGNGDTASVLVIGLVDDTEYHWQARAMDHTGRAGPWVSFGANTDPDGADFRTVVSDLPREPTGLDQLLSNGTSIGVGGITTESTVDFRATLSDPDGDNVQLQVELRPVGEDFAGTPDAIASSAPFASGTTVRLRVPVSDRTDYHWRARAVDANGLEGPWVAFGGNADTPLPAEIDYSVLIPDAPDAPTGLMQLRSDATTAIGVGETIDENTVVFTGTVSDPDPGDLVRLIIEVRPIGVAFIGIPTAQSAPVSSGSAPTITLGGLLDDTAYHWRAQTRDETGSVGSPWVRRSRDAAGLHRPASGFRWGGRHFQRPGLSP